jgi:hypothetical protein
MALSRLVALALACTCASCVPLPRQYYVPSTGSGSVRSMSCAGGPPYAASFDGTSPRYHLLVSVTRSSLILIINAEPSASIELDPFSIVVDAGGSALKIDSIRYMKTIYTTETPSDVRERIHVQTGHLQIDAAVRVGGNSEVNVRLPAITINGMTTNVPDTSFRLEKRVRLTMVIGNC